MIKYNTQEKKLKLPEYGRNVQKMVEHCLTIEDRDERMRCAYKIADIMAMTFPNEVGEDGDKKKIWDHINIMADFKLDIDFPCEVIEKEDLDYNPHKVPYNEESLKYRHYGKNIQSMIQAVSDMENCVEKDQMIFLIANQMKKLLVSQNPENATDARVFGDIVEISAGGIIINPENYRLNEYIGSNQGIQQKKKKKK